MVFVIIGSDEERTLGDRADAPTDSEEVAKQIDGDATLQVLYTAVKWHTTGEVVQFIKRHDGERRSWKS